MIFLLSKSRRMYLRPSDLLKSKWDCRPAQTRSVPSLNREAGASWSDIVACAVGVGGMAVLPRRRRHRTFLQPVLHLTRHGYPLLETSPNQASAQSALAAAGAEPVLTNSFSCTPHQSPLRGNVPVDIRCSG